MNTVLLPMLVGVGIALGFVLCIYVGILIGKEIGDLINRGKK